MIQILKLLILILALIGFGVCVILLTKSFYLFYLWINNNINKEEYFIKSKKIFLTIFWIFMVETLVELIVVKSAKAAITAAFVTLVFGVIMYFLDKAKK